MLFVYEPETVVPHRKIQYIFSSLNNYMYALQAKDRIEYFVKSSGIYSHTSL